MCVEDAKFWNELFQTGRPRKRRGGLPACVLGVPKPVETGHALVSTGYARKLVECGMSVVCDTGAKRKNTQTKHIAIHLPASCIYNAKLLSFFRPSIRRPCVLTKHVVGSGTSTQITNC